MALRMPAIAQLPPAPVLEGLGAPQNKNRQAISPPVALRLKIGISERRAPGRDAQGLEPTYVAVEVEASAT